jgi:hypothetical protein
MENLQPIHRVIYDEAVLKQFIEWLPELKTHERFYVSLFARRKYDDRIKGSDKANLRRFLADKEMLLYKIQQLELPVGRYVTKGVVVQDSSLALYINPNPRCMRKTSFGLVSKLMTRLENEQSFNPHADSMTMAHKSKSRTVWVDFDIDLDVEEANKQIVIENCVKTITEIVGNEAVSFVETRGGLHCLVEPSKVVGEKHWHQKITGSVSIDQQGDLLMPVPGCCQGGFMPRFVSR